MWLVLYLSRQNYADFKSDATTLICGTKQSQRMVVTPKFQFTGHIPDRCFERAAKSFQIQQTCLPLSLSGLWISRRLSNQWARTACKTFWNSKCSCIRCLWSATEPLLQRIELEIPSSLESILNPALAEAEALKQFLVSVILEVGSAR